MVPYPELREMNTSTALLCFYHTIFGGFCPLSTLCIISGNYYVALFTFFLKKKMLSEDRVFSSLNFSHYCFVFVKTTD